jgi:hypothetical protein
MGFEPLFPAMASRSPRAPKLRKLSGGRKRSPIPRFLRARQTRCLVILAAVEVIEKDSKRFPDTHGWGYATFEYDAVADTFTPAGASKPPQGHDGKSGAACHNLAASKDYIFTPYAKR